MTVTYPPTNRLGRWGESLRSGIPTLAETLKAHGYKTIGACDAGTFLHGLLGIGKGFDALYDKASSASEVTLEVLELLKKVGRKPFFLWVYHMDVHDYAPAKEFEGLYIDDRFYDKKNYQSQNPWPVFAAITGSLSLGPKKEVTSIAPIIT